MDLKNKLIMTYLAWLLLNVPLMGQEVSLATNSQFVKEPLSELLAKQATNNIRFITSDGKITYYQKRNGQLLLSQNYKITEVIKGSEFNHYSILGTKNRKKLIVTQNNQLHTFYSLRGLEQIYVINFGQSLARPVGLGNSPRLHLTDEWLSYYHHQNRTIYFEHTTNAALKFQILINARKNPYFTPQVVMFSEDQILYTDMNEDGHQGLFLFKRSTGKSELKYKQANAFSRIELCDADDHIFMGEFGHPINGLGSTIKKISLATIETFKDAEIIYSNNLNDPGNMNCREKNILYFSKNLGPTNYNSTYEIISYDVENKKEQVLTYFKSTNQLIDMDGVLLVSEKGKVYIVKGANNFKFIDVLAAPNKGENP